MKIVGIVGSMRTGNSEWMVKKVVESARVGGAEAGIVLLREKIINYCTGCDACDKTGECTQKNDDMQEIYRMLLESDVIVLGCPNYFKNVSGLMKNFMDRTNAFVRNNKRKLKGKLAVGLCVGGEELEDTQHCEDALSRFFKAHRMKTLYMVKAIADEKGSISTKCGDLDDRLAEIGRIIAKGDMDATAATKTIRGYNYEITRL